MQAVDTSAVVMGANYSAPTSLASAMSRKGGMSEAQADKVSKDFESNDIYKGMMMEQYGKQLSMSGGIGIATSIKRELMKHMEV